MEGVDRPLKILLYAYKTNEELILQIIEQLEKIYLAFHGIQIYLYSEQMIWIHWDCTQRSLPGALRAVGRRIGWFYTWL